MTETFGSPPPDPLLDQVDQVDQLDQLDRLDPVDGAVPDGGGSVTSGWRAPVFVLRKVRFSQESHPGHGR
ncbi:hypothetical protein ACWCQK_28705 [Streptomyces sp. NPDC002306]